MQLSHLTAEATQNVKHHDDMSDVMTLCFQQNVGKVKEFLHVHNPFDLECDNILLNIITQAVMSDAVEMGIIQRDSIGQEMFDKFV